jgi:hypothetical protein
MVWQAKIFDYQGFMQQKKRYIKAGITIVFILDF